MVEIGLLMRNTVKSFVNLIVSLDLVEFNTNLNPPMHRPAHKLNQVSTQVTLKKNALIVTAKLNLMLWATAVVLVQFYTALDVTKRFREKNSVQLASKSVPTARLT